MSSFAESNNFGMHNQNAKLIDEDDFLTSFGDKPTNELDKIFQATS